MKPKWTPRPDIKPGDIIGKPAGWTPESDLDHFMVCPGCGAIIDMRDFGMALLMQVSFRVDRESRSPSAAFPAASACLSAG